MLQRQQIDINMKNINTQVVQYNAPKYRFREIVEKIFGHKLENIHELAQSYNYDKFNEYNDQNTILHKMYYERIEATEFLDKYREFISLFVKNQVELITGDRSGLIYQAKPTIRFHMPNNVGVGNYHKDSDFGHYPEEINFMVPLTRCRETSAMWIESESDKGDFAPLNLSVGEVGIFDGANLTHGNKINETEKTRVSFDFRVIPKSKYSEDESRTSISENKKFVVGQYYCEL